MVYCTGNNFGRNYSKSVGTERKGIGVSVAVAMENIKDLVDGLNFAEKVDRSLDLIEKAYKLYGDGLVVANSLGKDSCVVWDLAKRVSPDIRGFVVTTRFKPQETKDFMKMMVG